MVKLLMHVGHFKTRKNVDTQYNLPFFRSKRCSDHLKLPSHRDIRQDQELVENR